MQGGTATKYCEEQRKFKKNNIYEFIKLKF